ncbi:NAD+ synthase [bacterium]|nr:NAD+ synthase [bacterium]
MRLALAQINPCVGDLKGNCSKILEYIALAKEKGADIVAFPELSLIGYPPEDLLLIPKFIEENKQKLEDLSKSVDEILTIVGFVDKIRGKIFNAAALIYLGKLCGVYHKMLLPNYGVFDEKRYFSPGSAPSLFNFGNLSFGIAICEDIWHKSGPLSKQAKMGAKLSITLNASPYHIGKIKERLEVARNQARDNGIFIAYVNLVGGQDELIFDGQSFIVDDRGELVAKALAFEEDLLLWDIPKKLMSNSTENGVIIPYHREGKNKPPLAKWEAKELDVEEEIYSALLLGIKDYVKKNGFQKVVLGLSGGIDSSLTAVLAADALGRENVIALYMPSRYSSQESYEDARQLAQNLGIQFIVIPIDKLYQAYLSLLSPYFENKEPDITEENLQARIRGNILMAFSNKFGWLVLTTGNKSELSTGYATLYGDMAGGFAPLKDVPKTLVYKLAKYRNRLKEVIPMRIFTKEPSAELKPNQKDSDTLPPYEILDPIIKLYVEENKDFEEIIALGYDSELVKKVLEMIDRSEYKRRQAPPGLKVTKRAFGKDRRMPITNKYRR